MEESQRDEALLKYQLKAQHTVFETGAQKVESCFVFLLVLVARVATPDICFVWNQTVSAVGRSFSGSIQIMWLWKPRGDIRRLVLPRRSDEIIVALSATPEFKIYEWGPTSGACSLFPKYWVLSAAICVSLATDWRKLQQREEMPWRGKPALNINVDKRFWLRGNWMVWFCFNVLLSLLCLSLCLAELADGQLWMDLDL